MDGRDKCAHSHGHMGAVLGTEAVNFVLKTWA